MRPATRAAARPRDTPIAHRVAAALATLLTLLLVAPPAPALADGPGFHPTRPGDSRWILMIPNLIYRTWHSTGKDDSTYGYPDDILYGRNVSTAFVPAVWEGKTLCITVASINKGEAKEVRDRQNRLLFEKNTNTAVIQLLLFDPAVGPGKNPFQLVGWNLQPLTYTDPSTKAQVPVDWSVRPTAATRAAAASLTWNVVKDSLDNPGAEATIRAKQRDGLLHGESLAAYVAEHIRALAALHGQQFPVPKGPPGSPPGVREMATKVSTERFPCPNCRPQLANRVMFPAATAVAYAFEESERDLEGKLSEQAREFRKTKVIPDDRVELTGVRPLERPGRPPAPSSAVARQALPARLAGAATALEPAPAPGATAVPTPGGIDFSTLELRYLADPGPRKDQGVRYAFSAASAPADRNVDAGPAAAVQASDSFFVWLQLSPDKFWVNLNPEEPDRIVDPQLGTTDAGRILLQADLRMKKTVANLIHPDSALGQKFWATLSGGSERTSCLSFRQWISPAPATVREDGDGLYIVDAPLTVQLESEFLKSAQSGGCPPADQTRQEAAYRSLILPKIRSAVNTAPEYAELRRVYLSRVAAEWYRNRSARQATSFGDMIDRGDVSAWPARRPWSPRTVFDQYVKSYTKGEFHVTHKHRDGDYLITDTYLYGGVDFSAVTFTELDATAFQGRARDLGTVVQTAMTRPAADHQNKIWLGAVTSAAKPPGRTTEPSGSSIWTGRRWPAAGILLIAGALVLLVLFRRRLFPRATGEHVIIINQPAVERGVRTVISVPGHPRLTVNIPPGARDGSLLRLPGKAGPGDRDDLFVRVRVASRRRWGSPRFAIGGLAALMLVSGAAIVMATTGDDSVPPAPVAVMRIPEPVVLRSPGTQPHTVSSEYAPPKPTPTEAPEPEPEPRRTGFTAGTCLAGKKPKGSLATLNEKLTPVSCGSRAAAFKVIKTFLGTSDLDRCNAVRRTQYAYFERLTINGAPVNEFVYCMIGV
ncbi:hypothetical protein [Actinoplanes sp. NPDC049265]|uniref:LppU/SCO3897 family protein n=1 Tax=Actinoplanes sp. NPDC049265 TaxID=3363902 RepID=UPI003714150A